MAPGFFRIARTSALPARFCALLAVAVAAAPAAGQDIERAVTLEETIELFAARNPSLQVLQADVEAVSGLARQAEAWPNPEASFTDEPAFGLAPSSRETTVAVNWRIEWPRLRTARIAAAKQSLAAERDRASADSLRLVLQVIHAYIDAALRDDRTGIIGDAAEVARQAEAFLARQFDEGEIAGLELHRMRVVRAHRENELATAEAESRAARMRLAHRARPDGEASFLVPVDRLEGIPEAPPLEDLLLSIATSRYDVRAFREDAAAAGSIVRESRLFRLPRPSVGAGLKRRTDGTSGLHASASVSLPVMNRYRGTIQHRTAQLRAAKYRLLLAERRAEAELRQAYDRYASLRDRMATVGNELVREAAAAVRSVRASFDEGEATIQDVLDAALIFREARLARLDMMAALWAAYFDVLHAAGRPLPMSFH